MREMLMCPICGEYDVMDAMGRADAFFTVNKGTKTEEQVVLHVMACRRCVPHVVQLCKMAEDLPAGFDPLLVQCLRTAQFEHAPDIVAAAFEKYEGLKKPNN